MRIGTIKITAAIIIMNAAFLFGQSKAPALNVGDVQKMCNYFLRGNISNSADSLTKATNAGLAEKFNQVLRTSAVKRDSLMLQMKFTPNEKTLILIFMQDDIRAAQGILSLQKKLAAVDTVKAIAKK